LHLALAHSVCAMIDAGVAGIDFRSPGDANGLISA
jgi:hypothetical protein